MHGTSARRKKLLKTEADFYIINHDGFNIISDDAVNMFDLVIVDEAAVLRNPSTNRFQNAQEVYGQTSKNSFVVDDRYTHTK